MKSSLVFLVIPTIRNLSFLDKWEGEFKNYQAVIVEDHPTCEITTPKKYFRRVFHYSWQDIRKDFGRDEWIFSRRNAGIRSYGFYKAYKLGADIVITLDDDCYPAEKNYVKKHLDNLNFKAVADWFPTYPDPEYIYTRGFPYNIRNKIQGVVSHGLWSGAIDLDAKTEVKLPKLLNEKPYPPIRQVIPTGYFFPMCSMNLAFRREIVPLMYFPLMGSDPAGHRWGYDRYDDIWAGLFVKKICDHLRLAIVNGSPFVEHRKASLPKNNLQREKRGLVTNETLWQAVNRVKLTATTPTACFRELAQKIRFPRQPYFQKLRDAMLVWISRFD